MYVILYLFGLNSENLCASFENIRCIYIHICTYIYFHDSIMQSCLLFLFTQVLCLYAPFVDLELFPKSIFIFCPDLMGILPSSFDALFHLIFESFVIKRNLICFVFSFFFLSKYYVGFVFVRTFEKNRIVCHENTSLTQSTLNNYFKNEHRIFKGSYKNIWNFKKKMNVIYHLPKNIIRFFA